MLLLACVSASIATHPAHSVDIQGHRGARGLAPENTLPAFRRALEAGATTLELDCGLTRDGVVVISHERRLSRDLTRDPQGHWLARTGPPIRDLTYAELQRYDVGRIRPGSPYAERFPRQQPVDGTPIPRLADLFTLVREQKYQHVRFNIETKLSPLAPYETASPEVFVQAVLDAVRRAGMAARVSIQSFDWRTLQIVQKEAPEIPTAYLTAQTTSPHNIADAASAWTAGYELRQYGGSVPRMIKAAGGAIWSPYYGDLTEAGAHEARSLGLKIVPWTVNEEADMQRLIAWGVHGIISDYPDVLARIARK